MIDREGRILRTVEWEIDVAGGPPVLTARTSGPPSVAGFTALRAAVLSHPEFLPGMSVIYDHTELAGSDDIEAGFGHFRVELAAIGVVLEGRNIFLGWRRAFESHSSGDVASAGITVAVPYSVTTTAWDLRDASSGVELNLSAAPAFADLRTFTTGIWPTAFNTANYLEFNENAALPAGFSVTGATFDFKFAAGASGDTACFYFEVRRASTGAVVGTHAGPGTVGFFWFDDGE